MLALDTAPVRKPMPVAIINTPIACSTVARWRFICPNSEEICSTIKAAIRKGMPRPAESKGKPHNMSPPQPDRFRDRQPALPHQQRDSPEPEKMQAHHDDDDAGQDRELCGPGADQAADQGRAGTKQDEHGGETNHE